jgi:tetratricopeptide (TPR) repeat protein
MLDESLLAKAIASGEAGHVKQAIAQFNAIIASTDDPTEKAIITFNKSSLYSAQGRLGEAREELKRALSLAPNDPGTILMYEFGDTCLCEREGKHDEFYEKLNDIQLRHPELSSDSTLRFLYEDIQRMLGMELARRGQAQDAIPILRESLASGLSPAEKREVLCNLGVCYVDTQQYELGRDTLSQAIEMGLDQVWAAAAHCYLGICYYNLGSLIESKGEFLLCEATGGGPGAPLSSVYGWLGAICKALGQRAESERYARLSKPV